MQRLKGCGFLFVVIILFRVFAFGDESLPLDLEPILVTKSRVHLLNSFTIEFRDMKDYRPCSFIERMSFAPLDLQSRSATGGIQTDFSLRGSNFQGVLMLLDGQRINDPQTGHHNCDIPFTVEDIERIDVIPGVSSSVFGTDAIGGAINILLKKPKEKKKILELKAGQYQTKSGLFSISQNSDNFGIRFSLENEESGGFSYDTDFKKFTSSISSSLDMAGGEFVFNGGYQEKEFGAFDFYTPGSNYPSKEWTKTLLLDSGLNLDNEVFIVKPNFLWRRHYDKFMLDKTQGRSTYLNHHRTDVFTPNIYFQKEAAIFGKIGLGLEYGQERIKSTNLGNHKRSHKSVFMDESKDFTPDLSLGLSLRQDDFEGSSKKHTGEISLRHKFSKRDSVSFGVSRSIRVASFTELYYSDPITLVNGGLSAEKSLNYQTGYDYEEKGLRAGFTFFFREERDSIDWIKSTPSQAKWQAENITKAEAFGMENYLNFQVNKHLSCDSNYTYIDKRINDSGCLYKYGPNYIRHLINTRLFFNLPFGLQSIGLTYKKKPNRDGWLLFDTYFNYRINQHSQIFLDISNIFNVEYQEIEGIPQPGRWAMAGIRIDW
jgi:iron complex outermembrane receptor protein